MDGRSVEGRHVRPHRPAPGAPAGRVIPRPSPRRAATSPRRAPPWPPAAAAGWQASASSARRAWAPPAPARIISASRSRAISRLRAWLRVSSTWSTMAPSFVQRRPASRLQPRLHRRRSGSGCAPPRTATRPRSSTLFTFCPPGPEARDELSDRSPSPRWRSVSVICSMGAHSPATATGPLRKQKGRRACGGPSEFQGGGPVRAVKPNQRSVSPGGCPQATRPPTVPTPLSNIPLDTGSPPFNGLPIAKAWHRFCVCQKLFTQAFASTARQ